VVRTVSIIVCVFLTTNLFARPSLGNPARGEAPHNGGVWELTSTILDKYEGYQASLLYPGYSSDFFDGLHHVVVRTYMIDAYFKTDI
jgi:hypothetical protein